jgi:hypothetical protein
MQTGTHPYPDAEVPAWVGQLSSRDPSELGVPHRASVRLGEVAVNNVDSTLGYLEIADELAKDAPIGSRVAEEMAHASYEKMRTELTTIRSNLRGLDDLQRSRLDDYLSHYIDAQSLRTTGHTSLTEWLGDEERGASDLMLLQFLGAHLKELARQSQSEKVAVAIGEAKDRRVLAEKLGQEQGWVSESASETAHEVYDTRVVIGDVWDVLVMRGYLGYHRLGADWIVVSQTGVGEEGERELLQTITGDVFTHEMNHRRFDDKLNLSRAECEALAQHVALSMRNYGKFVETMDPAKRLTTRQAGGPEVADEEDTYYQERALMAIELESGLVTISPKVALLAYTSGSMDSAEFKAYEQLLDQSWNTTDFRGKLARLIYDKETQLRGEDKKLSEDDIQERALIYAKGLLRERAKALKEA